MIVKFLLFVLGLLVLVVCNKFVLIVQFELVVMLLLVFVVFVVFVFVVVFDMDWCIVECFMFKFKVLDGSDYDLVVYCGKWVVVNFWVIWCVLCCKEMLELFVLYVMCDEIEVVGLVYEDIELVEMKVFLEK